MIYFKESMTGVVGERVALWERCFFGLSVLTNYYALSYISLADSSAIGFSAPVFVSVFACFLLKEPCGAFQISTVVATLIGVVLIARPSFLFAADVEDIFSEEDRIIGITLSVVTCLAMAYTYVSMRKLKQTPTNVVVATFSIFCIFVCSLTMNIWSFTTGEVIVTPHTSFDWMMIGVNGICGVLGQVTLVLALKLEEAGLVAVMRTFDIVVAFLFQAAFLSQPIHWTSILGAVIVCSGCIAVSLKKYYDSKREKEPKNTAEVPVV
jgi:drug/metabolite transporter (DMT)-like permease